MKYTESQQKAINEFGTNIIVSAGAGSGKTSVLSKRVLHHIENGIHVNELLILTFTKKAAKEMKDRIRKNLSNHKKEQEALSNSYITTFDSFSLSIVKKYHYLLNIKKDIDITDESIINILKNKVIDEVFDIYYQKNDPVFNTLILNNSMKNDEYIKLIIMSIASKIDKIGIEKYNSVINNFYTDNYIDNIYNEYLKLLENKRNYIKNIFNDYNLYFDNEYIEKTEQVLNSLLIIDIKNIYQIKEIKLPNLKKGSSDAEKDIKKKLSESIKELLLLSQKYGSYEDIKNNLFSRKDEVYKIFEISKIYIEKLNKEKIENNMYTFDDIAKLSIKILKENDIARKEVKSSFKEIMIDEYQDTNDFEDEFISLISNNNVYMVGDIKQSIYRFRDSNPDIFKEKYNKYKDNNEGIAIDLLDNFRSRNEVIKSINDIFSLIMDIECGGANYNISHKMIYGNKTYDDYNLNDYSTKILTYENTNNKEFSDNEIEIFTIANDIKEKINNKFKIYDKETSTYRPVKYSDFSIILDRSKCFNDYKKIFEYLSIPLVILKEEDLTSSPIILIIKNMIDIILRINKKDFGVEFKYDYFSIARSFLYEIDDNTLFETYINTSYNNTKIFKDFEIDNILSLTSVDILNYIIDKTNLYENIYKIGDYSNNIKIINKIYDLANDLNNKGYTINEFKEYIDNILNNKTEIKFDSKEEVDAVKILTIHASKGLEYPICYFTDLNHKFNTKELTELYLVDKKYGINNKDDITRLLYINEFINEEISEKIRLFYVAITRAKENIIIVIPDKNINECYKDEFGVIDYNIRNKCNKLVDFIYLVRPYLSNYFNSIDINTLNLTKKYLYKKDIKSLDKISSDIKVNEINIEKELIESTHFSKDEIKLIDKETENKMSIGTQVHEILEYLDFNNPIIDTDNIFIKNKILKFLSNDILKNINNATIYKEFEFIYETDKEYHGIIDLMLVYNDHIDIIDYKLKNVVDDAYKEQLKGYKTYISSIKNIPINTYLYSIIDEELIKI